MDGERRRRRPLGTFAVLFVAVALAAIADRRLPVAALTAAVGPLPAPAATAIVRNCAPPPPAAAGAPSPAVRRGPRFEDFPAIETHRGAPAPVDLTSHPDARRFRTRLRDGARRGPNFAGAFTVVTWGCGTSCVVVAVVDARSGAVFYAPFTAALAPRFRRDSRLLLAGGAAWEWTGGSFVPADAVVRAR